MSAISTGIQKYMIGFMRSKRLIAFLASVFILVSCNTPSKYSNNTAAHTNPDVIWDLTRNYTQGTSNNTSAAPQYNHNPTATPQLIKAINFDEAFSNSARVNAAANSDDINQGNDRTEWLYFSPSDYSSAPLDTLYAAFRNTGESTWTEAYYLEFYAGANPSNKEQIPLNNNIHPGEEAVFHIPITTSSENWKACWELKNPQGESFYEFCYNHGNGTGTLNSNPAQNTPNQGEQTGDVYFAFIKTNGIAPAKFSNEEQSAEFLSSSPANGHTFPAYDHYENLTVSFQNNGSETWDSSYTLIFYSGYNWMHANAFNLSGPVESGGTASITMPMEIIEDNDNWISCWYLSTPDGKNLSDFCFEYHTRS